MIYNVLTKFKGVINTFIEGLLIIFMIFGFCVGIAVILKLALSLADDEKEKIEKPIEKTYYVTEPKSNPQKPRKKRTKKPDLAFKGIILKPERYEVITEKIEQSKN